MIKAWFFIVWFLTQVVMIMFSNSLFILGPCVILFPAINRLPHLFIPASIFVVYLFLVKNSMTTQECLEFIIKLKQEKEESSKRQPTTQFGKLWDFIQNL